MPNYSEAMEQDGLVESLSNGAYESRKARAVLCHCPLEQKTLWAKGRSVSGD